VMVYFLVQITHAKLLGIAGHYITDCSFLLV